MAKISKFGIGSTPRVADTGIYHKRTYLPDTKVNTSEMTLEELREYFKTQMLER